MPIDNQHINHFSKFGLIANQVVEGFLTGLHKSPFHGFSVEFAEHKIYNTGDSTKNIDLVNYRSISEEYTHRESHTGQGPLGRLPYGGGIFISN